MKRCAWVTNDPLYLEYHDKEWGVPVYDDIHLFEMLLLEGAQAGLSWLTVLKRRKTYRIAYDGFDPVKMANWDNKKTKRLLLDPGIIRNKLKVESATINARAFLEIINQHTSFNEYIWSFVGDRPIQNAWQNIGKIPPTTTESDKMSKELKKRGFKFVGSTICYAFMQAVGMVNDHVTDCFRYETIKRLDISG